VRAKELRDNRDPKGPAAAPCRRTSGPTVTMSYGDCRIELEAGKLIWNWAKSAVRLWNTFGVTYLSPITDRW